MTLVALLAFLAAPAAEAPVVIWHQPSDRAVVEGGGTLHAVLETQDQAAGGIQLKANGASVPASRVVDGAANRTFIHYHIQLRPGLNVIEAGWAGGAETRRVFFSEPWGENRVPPAGFDRIPFHMVSRAGEPCADCHELRSEATDSEPSSPEKSTCRPCHFRITEFKQVHGPAARWTCTFCHDATSRPALYETPRPAVSDLCFICHTDLRDYFYASPYQHGPTATGRCTICHNPHASDNPFWLKKPAWYLCTTCHGEKASGRHVLAWGPSGDTHPTRGRPDPMKPDRELACNSCHNPHAAASPKLWNFGATTQTALCQTCHLK